MSATPAQSPASPSVIHAARVLDAERRHRKALEALRVQSQRATRYGLHRDYELEDRLAADVTTPVAELVALALHCDEDGAS